jgi:regulator of RNase E activity RraA
LTHDYGSLRKPFEEMVLIGDQAAVGEKVDGAVRDVAGVASLRFPCWSRGRTPSTGREGAVAMTASQ